MRRGDLVPIVLIGGIAAFVAVQALRVERSAPGGIAPASGAVGAATPQGATAGAPSPRPSAPDPGASETVVETVPSSDPAPERDNATIRLQIAQNSSTTYLQAILDEQDQMLVRWPDRRLDALRVWIDRQPSLPDWNPKHALVAERVFDEWRLAGFPVSFNFVYDSASSHIWIHWASSIAAGGRRIGATTKTRDQHGWIKAARIVVSLRDPAGRQLPESTVAGVVRHEVGHALGLGHSSSPADVMYPESRTPVISEADRATLHLLYRLPPGRLR